MSTFVEEQDSLGPTGSQAAGAFRTALGCAYTLAIRRSPLSQKKGRARESGRAGALPLLALGLLTGGCSEDGAATPSPSPTPVPTPTPVPGTIVEFVVPTPGSYPYRLTTAADGSLWFGELYANKLGRMTLAGVFTEFPLPTPESWPSGVVVAADGSVWFTEHHGHKVGRLAALGGDRGVRDSDLRGAALRNHRGS